MRLPDYTPPAGHSACVAVAMSPLLVLLAFVLVTSRLMDLDTALALVLACTVWVLVEMHGYQRGMDGYNAEYVARHLRWRSAATLSMLAAQDGTSPDTRAFVMAYLASGRVLSPDAPTLQ